MKYDEIAQAIYIVNKHAKTAIDSKYLYSLKKSAIQRLLKEGGAKKLGLHFSPNPKFCQQRLDLVIEVENYIFHIPPTKEDRESLPHLGERNHQYRNPKSTISIKKAKEILEKYTEKEMKTIPKKETKKDKKNNIFLSSYLGGKK